jgi:TDG/mug DNA glycosylase family protein
MDQQPHRKPTKAEVLAAIGRTVPDVIRPGLTVLFCGINPGLYTAAVGHHFARPGNRFWPALHLGGFTPRVFSPYEEQELLTLGIGITNMVDRATATADQLTNEELIAGAGPLTRKVKRYKPTFAAFVGMGAFRVAFGRPTARVGEQPDRIGETRVWLLPNPSGLNAHYTVKKLGAEFRKLYLAAHGGG